MKTYCKTIDITSYEHLSLAYDRFAKGRRNKPKFAQFFEKDRDQIIDEARSMIESKDLSSLRPIHYFRRHEPISGKNRIIGSECAMHQYLDYVAVVAMQDMLDAKIGFHQCASIKGKGQRHAIKYLKRWVRSSRCRVYTKLDIVGYYNYIDKIVLMSMIKRDVANEQIVWLVESLIAQHNVGLNIGSYLSQYLANYYLAEAYRYAYQLKKERTSRRTGETVLVKAIEFVLTYMDDWFLSGKSKKLLKWAVRKVIRFIERILHVQIKKWKISLIDKEPLDMIGYVFRRTWTEIRTGIFLRARRAFKRAKRCLFIPRHIAARCLSYWGYFKAACTRHWRKIHDLKSLIRDCKDVMSFSQIERNFNERNAQPRSA